MRRARQTKWPLRLAHISFVPLLLAVAGLLLWLAQEYHLRFDMTQNSRHSLSPASIAALERLPGPLSVTAFASRRGDTRRVIGELVARYQRHKPDLRLEYVDPDASPERARAQGVRYDGELLLEYGAMRENLSPDRLNEATLAQALTRLGHRGERWLVFLSSHGERSPDRQANFDLSTWAAELRRRGFKTRTLALAEHPQIPRNTSALVIAGPRVALLPGEVGKIENFVTAGGNLLWLADPGPLQGLEPLAEMLGIEFLPGVVVDPVSQEITGNPAAVVVARYAAHPLVADFGAATLFPHAAGISLGATENQRGRRPDADWRTDVLFDTPASSWAETESLQGKIQFDKGKDIRGPLNLGVSLTRAHEGGVGANRRQQRVVVIGDGDFLSNTFLGNGGNLELGLSLANWLSQDDAYVGVPVHTVRDRRLDLSRREQIGIAVLFLIALPLLLVGNGVFIWLRRRKR